MGRGGRALAAALAVMVAGAGVSSPTARGAVDPKRTVDGHIDDWRGDSSRIGGTTQWSRGELVYQDHLFDDLGPDTNQRAQQHGTVGAPKGDYRYPTDEGRYGNNAADLQELRLAPAGEDLWVLARLATLKQDDTTVVAVGFDVDGPASGGGPWPYDAGISAAGVDVVVTLWGTGGAVIDLRSGALTAVTDVAASTDDDSNAIEARVPRSIVGGASSVRVWAATGLWDAAASTWMAVPSGSPTTTSPGNGSPLVAARAFNVAFRPDETGSFMEEVQAAALATGDITPFSEEVDLDALAHREERTVTVEPGRFYDIILDEGVSIAPYGEGVSYTGMPGRFTGVNGAALSQHFDFFGRHQPYGLYVPSTYGTATSIPAALVLHGLGGSFSTYNAQPGFLRDMGEGGGDPHQPPMFLITPLARGSSFYSDWGEADTIAALEDVLTHFPIDRDRLYLTGYSMGGYGVYRFASLHPDWFAAAASWAGYTGEFTGSYMTDPLAGAGVSGNRGKANIGDPVQTLENLRELPLVHLGGTNDEIVPTPGQYAAPRRLSELGYRSRYDLYPGYEHFSFALVDDWRQVRSWLGDRRRVHAPRQVTYRFSDGWTAPGLADALGLTHDGAYWLRGLTMRTPTDDAFALATADAVSHAVPARAVTVRRDTIPASEPTPNVQQLVSWDEGAPLPVENRLDLRLTDVGTASISAADASLELCGLVVSLTTDGAVAVHLDGRVPATARVTGSEGVTLARDDGGITLTAAGPVDGAVTVVCH